MNYRKFGNTDLIVSEVGFGAWGIGGPAMAGSIPIGWGSVDDNESIKGIEKAFDLGINFFDTADFYGLGHSEELLGKVFKERWKDIILATKVGHELLPEGKINLNYSKQYIISSCEKSLKRLNKGVIDLYQLHSAKLNHLNDGDCIEAMELLKEQGKIRYWGISLNTFHPEPEADFLIENKICSSFQIVFNIINQKGYNSVIKKAANDGYGIIARMPLQFGLLTGKFKKNTRFEKDDHRYFRLPPELLSLSLDEIEPVFKIADKYGISKTLLAMSFILNHPEISTVIPGIKTEKQAIENTESIIELDKTDLEFIYQIYSEKLENLVGLFEQNG